VTAPRLYLITDRRATGGRPLGAVVAAALAGAERFRLPDGRLPVAVQLREKDLPARELLALAGVLRAVTAAARAELFVNDRLDVAVACRADGVHVPASGLPPEEARRLAPRLRVAVSTHDPAEVARARAAGADFAVFGPVFETPSKRAFGPARGLEALRAAAARGLPVLALGGVTPERADTCRAAGASGVSCIRAVLGAPDPGAVTAAFLARFT
jgi:thiamine-phosphate pyrophosphorylase